MQFEKAVQALCDAGVDFVVIGGLSATLHGSARVTYDLDICYSRASANLRRLTEALAPFHPGPRGFPEGLPFVWDEDSLVLLIIYCATVSVPLVVVVFLLSEVATLTSSFSGRFLSIRRRTNQLAR
jgi:hypothetical protein